MLGSLPMQTLVARLPLNTMRLETEASKLFGVKPEYALAVEVLRIAMSERDTPKTAARQSRIPERFAVLVCSTRTIHSKGASSVSRDSKICTLAGLQTSPQTF